MVATYWQTQNPSCLAWTEGWQPLGTESNGTNKISNQLAVVVGKRTTEKKSVGKVDAANSRQSAVS